MSEINSIANGTFTIGQTSATNFIAGPGITIDSPSAGTVRIGNDETVLWEGTATSGDITLSETYKNFEKIGIVHGCTYSYTDRGLAPDSIFDVDAFQLYNCGQIMTTDMSRGAFTPTRTGNNETYISFTQFSAVNDTKLHFNPAKVCFNVYPYNSNGTLTGRWKLENSRRYFKIYGINRISGSNA